MPQPTLYWWATSVALVASVSATFAIHRIVSRLNSGNHKIAAVIGFAFGVALGFFVLQTSVPWPPANALDRFLAILLPATFAVEVAATTRRASNRSWQVVLRLAVICTSSWILLYGSSYWRSDLEVSNWQRAAVFIVPVSLFLAEWLSTTRLTERVHDSSILIAIAMTIVCAGLLVMMAGYLKGGAAAFPLASALIGVAVVSYRMPRLELSGLVFMGLTGLFGIVFIGRFFGGLTSPTALVVFLAPSAAWVCEVPVLRPQNHRMRFVLRLIAVAIPLVVVFVCAWIEFEREMKPLL